MREQFEQDEIERERAKIIAEEEAKNLQRRLKRLQDGDGLALASPPLPISNNSSTLSPSPSARPMALKSKPAPSITSSPKASPSLPPLSKPMPEVQDADNELHKLADERFRQMQEQEELVKLFSARQ